MTKPLYTGDGIEAYDPMLWSYFDEATGTSPRIVGSGQQTAPVERPPSYLRRQSDAKVAALEAQVQRLEVRLAEAERIIRLQHVEALRQAQTAIAPGFPVNALRGSNWRPR